MFSIFPFYFTKNHLVDIVLIFACCRNQTAIHPRWNRLFQIASTNSKVIPFESSQIQVVL
ncbi:hypothetical protein RchiOBHm_Chr2g0118611 [Rosa chinensis]|uniref:Uncharacterized protein n=1 Tax=Rosa chinensis TaxID=74649 RepID=A0A2P6RRS4_ROSCH|nr:hypothetical protein RchiOBHm_Chr2g0118611 [Rosa chinensis]